MEKTTTAELRKVNRRRVFNLIYQEKKIAKQEIANKLQLSLPPVTQCLFELEQMKLIHKNGHFESSGGRKPQAISCIEKSRIALGVEVLYNQLRIVAIDLYGTILKEDSLYVPFRNADDYYLTFGEFVNNFVQSLRIARKRILGVGIAVQGLVSADGQLVFYSKILGNEDVHLADFGKHIPYPCHLAHDSEAAAYAELWFSKTVDDAMYIALSKHMGGAVVINSTLHRGAGIGSGLFEHMLLKPNGLPCYCGKNGCFEAYCSADALVGESGNLDDFFASLRSGEPKATARWNQYLDDLSTGINNLHMVIDCDVILGGHIAPYLNESDFDKLMTYARNKCSFTERRNYIHIGKCTHAVVPTGAALSYIQTFIESI